MTQVMFDEPQGTGKVSYHSQFLYEGFYVILRKGCLGRILLSNIFL